MDADCHMNHIIEDIVYASPALLPSVPLPSTSARVTPKEQDKWWSIGRGRKDSKEKVKVKEAKEVKEVKGAKETKSRDKSKTRVNRTCFHTFINIIPILS